MRTSFSTVKLLSMPCAWVENRNTSMEIVGTVHILILLIGHFPHSGPGPRDWRSVRGEPLASHRRLHEVYTVIALAPCESRLVPYIHRSWVSSRQIVIDLAREDDAGSGL